MSGIIWKLSVRDRLLRLALEVQQMQRHTEGEDAMLVWQTFLAAQRSMDEIRTTLVGGKLYWSNVPGKRSEEMDRENLEREKELYRCCENGMFDQPHDCRKKNEKMNFNDSKDPYEDVWDDECPECGDEGVVLNDCDEDTCCCEDPEESHGYSICPVCRGK